MPEFEKTFDNAVLDYEISRPEYPKELFDTIWAYKTLDSKSKVLEIGSGTGKATKPFLDKNCIVTALEPGKQLADLCMKKYAQNKNFLQLNMTLQEFQSSENMYDFIFAATAFHWIPEEYGYKRVFELLKNDGVFARFAYHAGRDHKRQELTEEINYLYKKYMNANQEYKEYSEIDAVKLASLAEYYGFSDSQYWLLHTSKDFTAEEYMALLRTYPDHIKHEEDNKKKLFDGIYSAIEKAGGVITVNYAVDLQMARKRV